MGAPGGGGGGFLGGGRGGGGAPPAANGSVHVPDDSSDEPGELTYVGIDTFEADF